MDRLGLACLSLLLLSPLVFKVRLVGEVVVHPFTPLLLVAWCWTLWAAVDAARSRRVSVEWHIVTPPVLLMGLVMVGLTASLAVNGLRSGSWHASGWLLSFKTVLYLAPLPFTALLVIRNGPRVLKVLNLLIPPVAIFTVAYSFLRFLQDPASYVSASPGSEPRFYLMGTFGEVLSIEGLVLRTDTVGQGAYGMYLALAVLFSLALALVKGLDAGLPPWFTRGQAFFLCPVAVPAILYTGSRTTLMLLAATALIFLILSLWRGSKALSGRQPVRFVCLLLLAVATSTWSIGQSAQVAFPTFNRLGSTVDRSLELQGSALGTHSPLTNEPRPSAVRNVESRVWLWGKSVRYIMEHPAVWLTGIGNDRRRFLEEVVGLAYEGDQIHFQTAHNLFLDVLVKGGIVSLALLILGCLWLLGIAVSAATAHSFYARVAGVVGVGWVLLSFWPPFMVVNLLGEEMFTDNLQLHWTMLFGLLLGLFSLASTVEGRAPGSPGSFSPVMPPHLRRHPAS